jgi:predicted nuclease with RNAse H fold
MLAIETSELVLHGLLAATAGVHVRMESDLIVRGEQITHDLRGMGVPAQPVHPRMISERASAGVLRRKLETRQKVLHQVPHRGGHRDATSADALLACKVAGSNGDE